jgi:hypothetical protein
MGKAYVSPIGIRPSTVDRATRMSVRRLQNLGPRLGTHPFFWHVVAISFISPMHSSYVARW